MKKFLSLFLVLTMVLSMLTLPTFAEGANVVPTANTPNTPNCAMTLKSAGDAVNTTDGVTEADSGYTLRTVNGTVYETVTYGNNEYLVIRNVDQFLKIDDFNGVPKDDGTAGWKTLPSTRIILADNIDFADVEFTTPGSYGGYIYGSSELDAAGAKEKLYHIYFEGNGYALNNLTMPEGCTTGLFPTATWNTLSISNLTVNNLVMDGVGQGSALFFSNIPGNTSATFTNVDVNCASANFKGNTSGIYVATISTTKAVQFTNCDMNITKMAATAGDDVGAYIGKINNVQSNVTLNNCDVTCANLDNVTNADTRTRMGLYIGSNFGSGIVKLTNCDANVTTAKLATRSAIFMGNSEGNGCTVTLKACTIVGNISIHANQAGCFIGFINNYEVTKEPVTYSKGTYNFEDCNADLNVTQVGKESIGVYLGMAFSASTLNFKNCKVYGIFDATTLANSRWGSSFVSTIGADNARATIVNFEGCDTYMTLIGSTYVAGYVGANKGQATDVKVNFKDCQNHATLLGTTTEDGSKICAWMSFYWDKGTVTFDNTTSNATIVAINGTNVNSPYNKDTNKGLDYSAETIFAGTADDTTNGKLAYKYTAALKAADVDAKYYYGQTIGTDAKPVVGGATVYEFVTNKVGTFYSNNDKYVYTQTDKVAAQYTAPDGEGKFNARVIIVVSEEKLAEIARVGITLTFKKDGEVVNTKTFGKGGIDSYYAVYAGDQIAQAAEGYVLVAVTVTGIPTAEWNQTEGTVEVTMEAFDANGDLMPEYTLA